MKPYHESGSVRIYLGDCREVLPSLSGITAIVTDPPYSLGFMGKAWDSAIPGVDHWTPALEACLPGAHLLAFGGTRTFHRLACAIEDAGWEIRDCLSWLYGQGFPKSLDVSKAIDKAAGAERTQRVNERWAEKYPNGPGGNLSGGDRAATVHQLKRIADGPLLTSDPVTEDARSWSGYGTALKPAWEPVILARKSLDGTVAENVQKHGCGALAIDACRIGTDDTRSTASPTALGVMNDDGWSAKPVMAGSASGRWPANVALDEEAARMLDEQSGELTSGTAVGGLHRRSPKAKHCYSNFPERENEGDVCFGDTGGASRFFYTAKADKSDRSSDGFAKNSHPTVKPTALMRWLVRMVAMPTRNLICDPFMGSGSTLVAARAEHVPCIGIELDERYAEIAARRLSQNTLAFEETA